ncbi:unnamed protein product [Auanema sp. JU1783]|nr:unnamed protein product [Auanema sp. JU1783]
MSSESTENLPEKSDVINVPAESITGETVTGETKRSDVKAQPTVPQSLSAIKLKEEEMLKRIAEMETKKAEIMARIQEMEEIGVKTEKLRQEKLEKIAKAQEREALLKTENEKLGLRKPRNAEEEVIFKRIVELESRKKAILDRIEDIERVKSKGLEYKERAEKLRQKLEEKRQKQIDEQQKETQSISVTTDNTDNRMVNVEEAVRSMNFTESCDENKNEDEKKTGEVSKTVETDLSISSPAVVETVEHTIDA